MTARLDGQTLSIQGETDLPDGALIVYEYKHERLLLETETYWGDGSATVQDGTYAVQADLSGWPPGEVEVWASFWTIGQPAEIVAAFGELGERLAGDNVSISKDGSVRRIEIIETVVVPDAGGEIGPVANGQANLRAGPGTGYDVVGSIQAGQPVVLTARNGAGDWLQLSSGAWVAAFLVDNAPGGLAVVDVPPPVAVVPTSAPVQEQSPPTAAPVSISGNVALLILVNSGREEVLGIHNDGSTALDVGGWRLDGSKGDDFCIIPGGTLLQPGEIFTVATGDSQPQGSGMKCGDKPIWNNSGEVIYLRAPDGQIIQVETR